MKPILSFFLILFSIESGLSQGTISWDWTWTGTNNLSDAGNGTLITGSDNGGGVYSVLDASGTINGYNVIGVTGNVYGFIPQQKLGYPLGTSGGANASQFVLTLSQGCYEMIEVDPDIILHLPPPIGDFYYSRAGAVSSFWDGSGSSVLNHGIFTISPEATPETSTLALAGLGIASLFAFRRRK
jgi:hypothetical protein